MFLASKFVDYDPLNLDILTAKIVYNRFSISEIKAKEIEMLTTIEFKVDSCTTYEFIQILFSDFLIIHREKIDEEGLGILEKVKQLSVYFAVMCCYGYNMLKYK
eukprot:TRINITY_DN4393_c0_g1_i4.p2 TRINITY_DN4393_c0_g1~~TRINITY_DN4393_c0_g1_i4.p2  ORF type:complete len:104 (-),score=32.22 TRINITY_DN4393_c0_g1_i4:462-773(-)